MQITEIQRTILPDIEIKRVAAYARVSSAKDAALHSVSAQISYYNEYIANHPGWDFAGIYADEGITGTKDARPEFQRMLADCRVGKIDMIITKSITRFARNTVTLLETVRELKLLDVDVYFEEQDIHSLSSNGELMLTLLAMYAEEEARNVSENQRWRIQKMFAEGRTNHGRMLGYRMQDGELVIVPEEAEIVRQIFTDYLSGMGREAICKKLNAQGLITIRKHEWQPTSILRILTNEKYTGDMLLQKTYIKDFRSKEKRINKGERRQYYVENSHESIISKDVFEAAQAEMQRRRNSMYLPETCERNNLFTSMIYCKCCGKRFQRKTAHAGKENAYKKWTCSTFSRKGKAYCQNKQIPEETLITKTKETLGLETLEDLNLRDYLERIEIDGEILNFVLKNGEEKQLTWKVRSRRESWTEERRQKAREKALERSTLNETN